MFLKRLQIPWCPHLWKSKPCADEGYCARGKKSRGGKLSHNFGVSIMRRLLLFLLLLGLQSEVLADGRVAITGVPVVGGHRTLYTAPPSEESQYDDYGRPFRVPYSQTGYAQHHPNHLTLGQGSIEGSPWYFDSAGYNSYHYGEHYQPTGGLTGNYSINTNSCGNSCSSSYNGGKLRELWIPIDRKTVPKMSVVTSPQPRYSGWYVNTPGFAGWLPGPGYIGPYGGYYDYLSRQPVWGQYQGHLYDKRLYREPPGGWETPQEGAIPPTMSAGPLPVPAPYPAVIDPVPESEVRHITVKHWNDDGTTFHTNKGSTWKLITGNPVPLSERNTKPDTEKQIDGYPVVVKHLDGSKQTVFHFVEWTGEEWKHTGQAWEKG
jgi:hypothetical protein